MNEHSIIMGPESVRGIIGGTKTMTRRICKPQFPQDADYNGAHVLLSPYGVIGDRLWVKEAWATTHYFDAFKPSLIPNGANVHYLASEALGGLMKRSPMFMPHWASRITLEVTDVRIERLQDISPFDAIKEGYPDLEAGGDCVLWYARLWNKINVKRGYPWSDNPWVWVIEFKRVEEQS